MNKNLRELYILLYEIAQSVIALRSVCSKALWKDENNKKPCMIKLVCEKEASKNEKSFSNDTGQDGEIYFDDDIQEIGVSDEESEKNMDVDAEEFRK